MATAARCQHCGEPLPSREKGSQRCPDCGKITLLKRPREERKKRWYDGLQAKLALQTQGERRALLVGIAVVVLFLLVVLLTGL